MLFNQVLLFRKTAILVTALLLSSCAPMDLVGTFDRSCESLLPDGEWSDIGYPDKELIDTFGVFVGGDQPAIAYLGSDGSMALCAAANGGFFPRAGAMFVSNPDGTVSQINKRQ